MTEREEGVDIPGLTDAVLRCASPPFDLVLRWARYVPLSALLEQTPGFMVRGEPDNLERVLDWRTNEPFCSLVRIPMDLYDATRNHIEATRPERRASPDWVFSMSPFFANGRFVSVDDVFAHVADIVATIRLLGDGDGREG